MSEYLGRILEILRSEIYSLYSGFFFFKAPLHPLETFFLSCTSFYTHFPKTQIDMFGTFRKTFFQALWIWAMFGCTAGIYYGRSTSRSVRFKGVRRWHLNSCYDSEMMILSWKKPSPHTWENSGLERRISNAWWQQVTFSVAAAHRFENKLQTNCLGPLTAPYSVAFCGSVLLWNKAYLSVKLKQIFCQPCAFLNGASVTFLKNHK